MVFAWVYIEPFKQGFDLDSCNVEQKLLVWRSLVVFEFN
jgi:hypothetical protein